MEFHVFRATVGKTDQQISPALLQVNDAATHVAAVVRAGWQEKCKRAPGLCESVIHQLVRLMPTLRSIEAI